MSAIWFTLSLEGFTGAQGIFLIIIASIILDSMLTFEQLVKGILKPLFFFMPNFGKCVSPIDCIKFGCSVHDITHWFYMLWRRRLPSMPPSPCFAASSRNINIFLPTTNTKSHLFLFGLNLPKCNRINEPIRDWALPQLVERSKRMCAVHWY